MAAISGLRSLPKFDTQLSIVIELSPPSVKRLQGNVAVGRTNMLKVIELCLVERCFSCPRYAYASAAMLSGQHTMRSFGGDGNKYADTLEPHDIVHNIVHGVQQRASCSGPQADDTVDNLGGRISPEQLKQFVHVLGWTGLAAGPKTPSPRPSIQRLPKELVATIIFDNIQLHKSRPEIELHNLTQAISVVAIVRQDRRSCRVPNTS